MQCKYCGAYNPNGAQVCSNCKAPLVNNTIPVGPNQQFRQPGYPNMGQYPAAKQKNNNRTLLITIIALLVVLVLVVVILIVVSGGGKTGSTAPVQHDTVVETQTIVVKDASGQTGSSATPASARNASGGDYSWISNTYLTNNDVASKSKSELRIMRNTIYARHGYKFKSADLQQYFSRFDWYYPSRTVVPTNEFNAYEQHNINLIQAYE